MKNKNSERDTITYWGTAFCCEQCARKLSRSQEIYADEDSQTTGQCAYCMNNTILYKYIFRPLAQRKFHRYSGGGEKARAGK